MAIAEVLETFGYLFYAVSPNRTSFETVHEVPEYTIQVVPCFIFLFFVEQIFLRSTNKRTMRINDMVGSGCQGMLSEITRLLLHGWKLAGYIYIYNNWRFVTLQWNSLWTWWLTFLSVDFLYYWGHRATHEINFLWASHQVHHSSEDYNLSTAIRQSVFQTFFMMIFNLPMALAIPPSVFLVHSHFNLLYQFWIHTEAIKSLGPFEYILNTASHHRVHHGRNRYCIDKNYGGTLIIWDRMFGTFEPEGEKVVYGLTHPINSFDTIYIQMCHYLHIWKTFGKIEGWMNKLSVIIKGPGWSPGKPWHGKIEDIPDVKAPVKKYDPKLPSWCKHYVHFHLYVQALLYYELAIGINLYSKNILCGGILYLIYSIITFGVLVEGRNYASWMELFRCFCYIGLDFYFLPYSRVSHLSSLHQTLFLLVCRLTFIVSGIIWMRHCITSTQITFQYGPKRLD